GPGDAVRRGREVRVSGSPGDRRGRRRRDADARQQRVDHRRRTLQGMEGSAARRDRAQQRRPQPGHVGAARDGRRSQVRGIAEPAAVRLRALRADARARRNPGRHARQDRARARASAASGPADADRVHRRSRGAAAAAARHVQAGEELHVGRRPRRRAPLAHDRPGREASVGGAEMTARSTAPLARIDRLEVRACNLETESGPESDGTATWDSTTMVIVQPRSEGITGLGYSYVAGAAAGFIRDVLAPAVVGRSAYSIAEAWTAMRVAARNHGATGLVAYAISAVDIALWDLKAKLLGLALADLLGAARARVPVYASGGFT